MSTRRSKHIVTLLLLLSAIVTSLAYYNNLQPVVQTAHAAPVITLSPNAGQVGKLISFTGTGFTADTSCSVGGSPVSTNSCITPTATTVSGSFVVANVAPGPYTITITGSPTGDFGQATFQVVQPALNKPQPPSGPPGTAVTITNSSSFASSDTTCSVSGTPVNSGACNIDSILHKVTATFVVGNVAPATYVITVSGSPIGDSAQALFNVTLPLNITIKPNNGPRSTQVLVFGAISPSDATCSISGTPVTQGSCVIYGPPGKGYFNASFIVGNVAVGPYTITISGNTGDTIQTTFTVTGPSITISPASGLVGALVLVNGTGYSFQDTTCTISSPTSGSFVVNPACSIIAGTGKPSGSFTVGNVPPGSYVVQLSGNTGDFAEKTFHVVSGPKITLSPGSGGIGIQVIVNGTGFQPSDTSCSISGTPVLNGACSVSAGTGAPSATFIVANIAPGSYVITLSASPAGDFAQATFIVTTGPTITLTPNTGRPGSFVSVTGTAFSASDNSCTISGTGGVVLSQSCGVVAGSKAPTGTFVVNFVVPGSYLITLTGNTGDFGSAVFRVTNVTKSLTLFPAKAPNGATVTFRATGFNSTDTACSVETNNPSPFASFNNLLITSPSCSMSSTVATGSFVVGPLATQDVKWNVTVRGTPQNDIPASASFNVTATIVITPTVGNIGNVFSFTGSGFHSDAVECTTLSHFSPALGGGSSLASNSGGCGLNGSTGQLTGTFTPKPGTVAGVFVLVVTDNKGSSASASFTIGTPSAQITISPNAVVQPPSGNVFVGISGSGFNPGDTSCHFTPRFTVSNCAIGSGSVSGSITINSTLAPGLYLITITGDQTGDFASNYLSIITLTTTTATSTSTTTSTTATTTTTFTTSTSVSQSLTSSTITIIGPTTIVFPQGTFTTVSAVTTTTSTTVGFTASPTTATTTTLKTVTFGQIIGPSLGDELSVLGMLGLVIPILLRRLVK